MDRIATKSESSALLRAASGPNLGENCHCGSLREPASQSFRQRIWPLPSMSRRLVQQLTGQASAFAKQGSLRFTTSAQCLQAAEPAPDIVSTAPRPGESRPAVSDVHRGPTGPIEVGCRP